MCGVREPFLRVPAVHSFYVAGSQQTVLAARQADAPDGCGGTTGKFVVNGTKDLWRPDTEPKDSPANEEQSLSRIDIKQGKGGMQSNSPAISARKETNAATENRKEKWVQNGNP